MLSQCAVSHSYQNKRFHEKQCIYELLFFQATHHLVFRLPVFPFRFPNAHGFVFLKYLRFVMFLLSLHSACHQQLFPAHLLFTAYAPSNNACKLELPSLTRQRTYPVKRFVSSEFGMRTRGFYSHGGTPEQKTIHHPEVAFLFVRRDRCRCLQVSSSSQTSVFSVRAQMWLPVPQLRCHCRKNTTEKLNILSSTVSFCFGVTRAQRGLQPAGRIQSESFSNHNTVIPIQK